MLLINKITFNQLSNYRKDVIKCLKNNINNTYINEILIFLDVIDENLPKHNKIKYITKPKYSDLEIIEYSKKVSNRQNIIFTKSLYNFGQELKNFNIGDYIENSNFIFFKRNYDIKNKLTNDIDNKVVRNKPIRVNKPSKLEIKENVISNKLDVVIVSVNYNDYLKISLENNTKIFDNITVVTSDGDIKCQEICKTYGVNCVICDNILKDGIINKSIGLNKGINSLNNPDWILILDADIIVNNKIETQNLDYKNLYTNSRWIIEDINLYNEYKSGNKQLSNFRFERNKGIGFFQLFNFKFKKRYPDSNWGRYSESSWSDVIFKRGFKNVDSLNLEIIHLGKPYQKWLNNKLEIQENKIDIPVYKKNSVEKTNGVSIIIPAYKATKFIKECLESILSQNLNDIPFEINIGIDSCEETLNFIKENKFIYNNCNIFYFEENYGPYLIRNTLSKFCKYENIIYFDADDIMNIDLISKTLIKLTEYNIVRWKFINFHEDLNDGESNDWHAHGVFGIKKDIFLNMNGFSPWRIGADTEFLERSKKFKVKTFHTEEIMFYRRQHDDNQTRNTKTGMGTPARIEVQKKLSIMRKENNFENPEYLNIKKYTLI